MNSEDVASGFHGTYFPYSRMQSAGALRRACLLFDSVTVLEPNQVDFWKTPEHDRKHLVSVAEDLRLWRQETQYLRDAGVLRAVTIDSPQPTSGAGETLWWLLDGEDGRRSAWNRERVPRWASFLTHMQEEQSAVPFSDDPVWDASMRNVFQDPPTLRSARLELGATTAGLALEVFRARVPSFETRSYEDVLWLREALKDALDQYRTYMRAAATSITSQPWDAEYPREIARLLAETIEPALLDLEREAKALPRRRAALAAKAILGYKPLAIVGTVFVGLPTEVAALAAGGVASVDTYLEARRAGTEIRTHGLALLLRAEVTAP